MATGDLSDIYCMNESYEQYEIIRGRKYRYDPDSDCWYAVPVKLSRFDQWSWIVSIILLAGICGYLEYLH